MRETPVGGWSPPGSPFSSQTHNPTVLPQFPVLRETTETCSPCPARSMWPTNRRFIHLPPSFPAESFLIPPKQTDLPSLHRVTEALIITSSIHLFSPNQVHRRCWSPIREGRGKLACPVRLVYSTWFLGSWRELIIHPPANSGRSYT